MKKIAFVKLGAIGDAVMALDLLPAIDNSYPDASLTWMCGKTIEPLLRLFPRINELIVVDESRLFNKSRANALLEILRIQKVMLGTHFDLLLHGNADWRYKLLSITANARITRSWNRVAKRPWPIPGRYHGHEYARMVLGDIDGTTQVLSTPQVNPELLPPLPSELNGSERFIVLSPGGAKNLLADDFRRRWPVEYYASLALEISKIGKQVVLVGGPGDSWVKSYFSEVPHIDLIGRTTIPQLLTVFKKSVVVVSHDTASAHLPRLVKTPVITLFGPTNPADFRPFNATGRIIWGGDNLPCRPCYEGKRFGCCKQNICMHNITVEKVLSELQSFLA